MVLVLYTREGVGVMTGTSDAPNFRLLPATPLGDSVTPARSLPLSGPHLPPHQTGSWTRPEALPGPPSPDGLLFGEDTR